MNDLPAELQNAILSFLEPVGGLFATMQCSHSLSAASRSVYASRQIDVGNSMKDAVDRAAPGDTLCLSSTHTVLEPICISQPLRLVGTTNGSIIILQSGMITVSTAGTAVFDDVRIFDASPARFPNTTIVVECGTLVMSHCHITHDLRAEIHKCPIPGDAWSESDVDTYSSYYVSLIGDGPMCGIWVKGHLDLQNTHVWATRGPAVKVLHGNFTAVSSTLAFARRGGNLVMNGGSAVLDSCTLQASLCDGVSTWNNSKLQLTRCTIRDNVRYAIARNGKDSL